MSAFRIHIMIQGTPSTVQVGPTAGEIGEQIRQSLQDAAQQMRDGAQQARDAQQRVRDAEQRVREARLQVRSARTNDQRGAAEQALSGAQTELNALQGDRLVVHTLQPPAMAENLIPPQAVDISIAFFVMCAVMVIGWPIARALGRRLERRGEVALPNAATAEQLRRIEQAVEAMAIEVERISESQRFMAKLQQAAGEERAALPTGDRR
jgi:hypothetical protein